MTDDSQEAGGSILQAPAPTVPNESTLLIPDQFAAAEYANPMSAQVSGTQHSPSMPPLMARAPRPHPWRLVIGLVLVAMIAGVLAYVLIPRADDRYVHDLTAAGLMSRYPSRDAAIDQGRAFCRQLDAGQPASGTAADLIAVRAYCPDYEPGFTVVQPAAAKKSATAPQKKAAAKKA